MRKPHGVGEKWELSILKWLACFMLSITVLFFIYNCRLFYLFVFLLVWFYCIFPLLLWLWTFINKIMRWKLYDRWMNENQMIYRNKKKAKARISSANMPVQKRETVCEERERSKNPHQVFSSNQIVCSFFIFRFDGFIHCFSLRSKSAPTYKIHYRNSDSI